MDRIERAYGELLVDAESMVRQGQLSMSEMFAYSAGAMALVRRVSAGDPGPARLVALLHAAAADGKSPALTLELLLDYLAHVPDDHGTRLFRVFVAARSIALCADIHANPVRGILEQCVNEVIEADADPNDSIARLIDRVGVFLQLLAVE